MPEQTIYEYMKDSLLDGSLPPDFSLSAYDRDGYRIRFADGAMDGMSVYHMTRPEIPDGLQEAIGEGIAHACDGGYDAANVTFERLGDEYRAIWLIDELQRYVVEHTAEIDAGKLWAYATSPLFCSTNKELIKIGLSLLELFGEPDEDMKQVVRMLGLSDEFTIFAAWCARGWENGNDELFQLAKRTRGWGRIHVIEMLEPVTEEIRDWLLLEGINNDVVPEYSALTCYEKANVRERLGHDMGHDEFAAIGVLVASLVEEGPVAGISGVEDGEGMLAAFLEAAKRQQLDLDDYGCVFSVRGYASDGGYDSIVSECDALLSADAARECIADAVRDGKGIELAMSLGIPYEDALLAAMRRDFDGLYASCRYLMEDDKYLTSVLDLFREKIPLESIGTTPQDEIGLGREWGMYNKLDFLIQSLRHKMPTGLDVIIRTLAAPTVRNRTMSHRVLRTWVSDTKTPLSELSPEAYARLQGAYGREPREDLREAMRPLLDGAIEFDEDEM